MYSENLQTAYGGTLVYENNGFTFFKYAPEDKYRDALIPYRSPYCTSTYLGSGVVDNNFQPGR